MKKILKAFLIVLACAMFCVPSVSCKNNDSRLQFFMPDGAPAFAVAGLMHKDAAIDGKPVKYSVVKADAIGQLLAQKKPDFALIPVTASAVAEKNGYQMTHLVTHGNIYLISKNDGKTSLADFAEETIGVVNLNNVPGLTFRAIIKKMDITGLKCESKTPDAFKAGNVQSLVVPEPKLSKLLSTFKEGEIKFNKGLHEFYNAAFGTANGFPQAVLVAKKELVTQKIVDELQTKLTENGAWVSENTAEAVLAVKSHLPNGQEPDISQLTPKIFERCSVYPVRAKDGKPDINQYLTAIKELLDEGSPMKFEIPGDGFYYSGD